IDLNYSELFDFSENDFTVPGPGAVRGIKKCFTSIGDHSPAEVIMWMVEHQEEEFERLGLDFKNLWGRPLHAIDCQGLFCETDKYARVKFPEVASNRVRMKAKFAENPQRVEYFFPPKWRVRR
ncbi:MAG TPA: nucleotide kinase domain-containing protein, partial [Verrucomicrobiae bacterium]|nr:nucleotide kinase domain-containing protein [Verrucomicrobiae bacterium]